MNVCSEFPLFASQTICFKNKTFLIISEWDVVVKSRLVDFNELACPFFFSTFIFLFFSILLSLSICQYFLFLSISSFFLSSSLSTSLFILHYLHPLSCIDLNSIDWALSAWPHFQPLIVLHNDLSCLRYDAYMLQPLALWIDSHTLSILKGKLKKEEFGRHFISFCSVWQYRSCVSQCYCSVSKASHSALVAKWPVLSVSLLCL